MNIPLSPCVPENLVSRDGFSRPVPRQPAHLHTQAESGAYLPDSSRVPRNIPSWTFPSGVLVTPGPLSYPRGDRFPQKIYIPPRDELRGYYGSSTGIAKAHHTFFYVVQTTYQRAYRYYCHSLLLIQLCVVIPYTIPLHCRYYYCEYSYTTAK